MTGGSSLMPATTGSFCPYWIDITFFLPFKGYILHVKLYYLVLTHNSPIFPPSLSSYPPPSLPPSLNYPPFIIPWTILILPPSLSLFSVPAYLLSFFFHPLYVRRLIICSSSHIPSRLALLPSYSSSPSHPSIIILKHVRAKRL